MIMALNGKQDVRGCHPQTSEAMIGSRRGTPTNVLVPGPTRLQTGNIMTTPPVETVFIVGQNGDHQFERVAASWGLTTKSYPSAHDVLEANVELQSGCLITELRLPDMSGIELIEELKQRGSILTVVVLTAHADVASAVKAMRLGALTVLEKPCSESELSSAIHEAVGYGREQADVRLKALDMRSRLNSLNRDEGVLVEMILEGVKNNAIARSMGVSLRTIENRRRRVYEKMGADCIADLVQRILLAKQTW
jgi:two-component system, LuxR family, response regulator FixJ